MISPSSSAIPAAPFRSLSCTAFDGYRCVASGDLATVAQAVRELMDTRPEGQITIFDDRTSEVIEVDFRGTVAEVIDRLRRNEQETSPAKMNKPPERRGPGRPRLGVEGREVTLLPRHWEWLDQQTGRASVALRRLVEEAKRSGNDQARSRQAQEAVHRFMYAMAGNLPGFEEASRAFYRKQPAEFAALIASWPEGIRNHLQKLVKTSFQSNPAS